jgi:zinc transport system permease protein
VINPLDMLRDPFMQSALVTGLALVALCASVSVLVVLKRLAFVGQGVSHSAFGGIGLAAVLSVGLAGAGVPTGWLTQGGVVEFVIVLAFCVGAALLMAAIADRTTLHVDTGIGLLLVASMALGGVLVEASRKIAEATGVPVGVRSWESVLFGSLASNGWNDAIIAWGVALAVLLTLWIIRRPLVFWAFDEQVSPAFGVPSRRMSAILMVVLAVVVVTSMKLAGVVPATAMLVLPGAIALKLGSRMGTVTAWAVVSGVVGLLAGLMCSMAFDVQPGPCIVLILTALFGVAAAVRRG